MALNIQLSEESRVSDSGRVFADIKLTGLGTHRQADRLLPRCDTLVRLVQAMLRWNLLISQSGYIPLILWLGEQVVKIWHCRLTFTSRLLAKQPSTVTHHVRPPLSINRF